MGHAELIGKFYKINSVRLSDLSRYNVIRLYPTRTAPMIAKISYRIPEFCQATGLGRSAVYKFIQNGELRIRKAGRITIIDSDEAQRFVASLPSGVGSAPAKA
jgi:hypothetical protein